MSLASVCLRHSLKRPYRTSVFYLLRQHNKPLSQGSFKCASQSLSTSRSCSQPDRRPTNSPDPVRLVNNRSTSSVENRLRSLSENGFQDYPRCDERDLSDLADIKRSWRDKIPAGQTDSSNGNIVVIGRVSSVRIAGSKLAFVDLRDHQKDEHLQIVVNNGQLEGTADPTVNHVKAFTRHIQRGDVISVTGHPHRTRAGELSILATSVPQLLSPCLHEMPATAPGDDSDLAHERHVEMLTDSSIIKTILARSIITNAIQSFLQTNNFVNVQTPILAASAGGAIARSFETRATEFPQRKLALRIAPELWLKRLIVGGLERVYEIGPSFRNEGLDRTHNPEFTTCEFYATSWTLNELQKFTQTMIMTTAVTLAHADGVDVDETFAKSVQVEDGVLWRQIDFIPAINAALGTELPELGSVGAREKIMRLFSEKNLPLPSTPTLPRLLDKLCSTYVEPNCHAATWIINTPECLSPLAKSFAHPDLPGQRVAARAELFIHGKEVVNCYEEENSPVEQRRKFVAQQETAQLANDESGTNKDDEAMQVDEGYLRALEWGLPPTGGWGCGIDRLVMLMLGKDKISDVLTFGNLRMVTRHAEKVETTNPS